MSPCVQPQAPLIKELQHIAEDLYEKTQPFRVTIRVQSTNDQHFPVLAEVNSAGALSLAGGMSAGPGPQTFHAYDIHVGATVVKLRNDRDMIVQNDTRTDEPLLPESYEFGSIWAQILTVLEHDGEFVGIVSVHSHDPRTWTDADISAARDATRAAQQVIDKATWFDIETASAAATANA